MSIQGKPKTAKGLKVNWTTGTLLIFHLWIISCQYTREGLGLSIFRNRLKDLRIKVTVQTMQDFYHLIYSLTHCHLWSTRRVLCLVNNLRGMRRLCQRMCRCLTHYTRVRCRIWLGRKQKDFCSLGSHHWTGMVKDQSNQVVSNPHRLSIPN